MDGPRDYHTMWSESDRGKEISYGITYAWNAKSNTSELFRKQKQVHRQRKQTYGYEKGGGGIYWE